MTGLRFKVVCIFLFLSVGAGAVLGYYHIKITKEQTILQHKVEVLNKKVDLLRRKYAEKRVLAERQLRGKSALAGQKRVLEAEVERIGKENISMLEENRALNAIKEKLRDETLFLRARYSNVKTKLADLNRKYGRVVMGFDQDLKRLAVEKKTLRSEVRKERQKLQRCETRNAKVCLIANELIEKYQDKGLGSVLMQKEPFTRLKKVELKRFIQEYKEKIEEQKAIPW